MSGSTATGVDFTNVPDDLRNRDHWLTWDYREQDGQLKKPPINEHGYKTSAKDPENWLTLGGARARYATLDVAGVGFVLNDTPFVGIDLDDCFNEDGDIVSSCADIIRMLPDDVYIERSPSRAGIHAIVHGTLPNGSFTQRFDDGSKAEFYEDGRYFTVTGDTSEDFPVPENGISTAQSELEELDDSYNDSPTGGSQTYREDVEREDRAVYSRSKASEGMEILCEEFGVEVTERANEILFDGLRGNETRYRNLTAEEGHKRSGHEFTALDRLYGVFRVFHGAGRIEALELTYHTFTHFCYSNPMTLGIDEETGEVIYVPRKWLARSSFYRDLTLRRMQRQFDSADWKHWFHKKHDGGYDRDTVKPWVKDQKEYPSPNDLGDASDPTYAIAQTAIDAALSNVPLQDAADRNLAAIDGTPPDIGTEHATAASVNRLADLCVLIDGDDGNAHGTYKNALYDILTNDPVLHQYAIGRRRYYYYSPNGTDHPPHTVHRCGTGLLVHTAVSRSSQSGDSWLFGWEFGVGDVEKTGLSFGETVVALRQTVVAATERTKRSRVWDWSGVPPPDPPPSVTDSAV